MDATSYRTRYREYVGAIYELAEEGLPVHQAKVAEWLGVSRPSVSEMVHRMEVEGLVTTDGEIRLTAEGNNLAEVVVRRHRLAERFLTEVLGLPWVKVHGEAEVWENIISDDVEKAMWTRLGDAKTCPHGNPIPGAGYKAPPVRQLAEVGVGAEYPLERISEELELDSEIMGFLDGAKIHPGAGLTVVEVAGQLTVKVNGAASVPIDRFVAERLFVAVPTSL